MSRVALADVPSLTFYKGSRTRKSRRGLPSIPQLTCIGQPCNLYQPEVIRCTNEGGEGSEIDWKCDADLPEALRFGRVEVSCEGWNGPGDPYVLKGSCSLEYRLVRIPKNLDSENRHVPGRWFENVGSAIFTFMWLAVLLFIFYNLFKSCFSSGTLRRSTPGTPRNPPWSRPGGFWPRDDPPTYPPPPYDSGSSKGGEPSGPGFWTGVGLGSLGAAAATQLFQNRDNRAGPRPYDWEGSQRNPPPTRYRSEDRGEGSSNLGAIRRSTGLGGSNVR